MDLCSLVVKNCVIFYQPTAVGIEVLYVLHVAPDICHIFDEMVGGPCDDEA